MGKTSFRHFDRFGNDISAISGTDCSPALGGNNLFNAQISGNFIFKLFGHFAVSPGQFKNLLITCINYYAAKAIKLWLDFKSAG
jgi:hypothetical protein